MADELTAGWNPAHPAMPRDNAPARPADAADTGPDPGGGRTAAEAVAAAESAASAAAARASAAIAAAARLAAEAEAAAIAANRAAGVLAAAQERGSASPRDPRPVAPPRAVEPDGGGWTSSPVGPVHTPGQWGSGRPTLARVVERVVDSAAERAAEGAAEVDLLDGPALRFDVDAATTELDGLVRAPVRAGGPRPASQPSWSGRDAAPLDEPAPDLETPDDTQELTRIDVVGVVLGPGVDPAPDPLDPTPLAGRVPSGWGGPVTEPFERWSDPSINRPAVEQAAEPAVPARGARHRSTEDADGVEDTVSLHPPARRLADTSSSEVTVTLPRPTHLRLAPAGWQTEPVDGPGALGPPEGPLADARPAGGSSVTGPADALAPVGPDAAAPCRPGRMAEDVDPPAAVPAEACAGRLDKEPIASDGPAAGAAASELTAVDTPGDGRDDSVEPAPSVGATPRSRPLRGLLAVAAAIVLLGVAGLITTLVSEPVPEPMVGAPIAAPPVAQPAPVPTPPPLSPIDAPLRAAADPGSAQAAALLEALRRAGVPTSRNGAPEAEAAELLCRQMDTGADTGSLIRTLPAVLPTVTSAQAPVVVDAVSRHYC